ncbi:unnamed protein product [Effrenium voratum]|nr:unnamed protein product [Effrenium voratum]|mmetsp:Transcript_6009/g.14133  ORF Transcript_6009/g.14133 Transcript_6009/m.14133 type:complete len:153 (+) Transcript_6009:127-585(+)
MPAVSDFSAYPADRAGSKSEKSGTPAQFECRLAWTECDSPKSAPGNLDAGRTNKSFKSKFSSGSVTSEPRSPSTASCPDLRRMNQRQEFLTNLRPSPTNPRQVMSSGENVNGSASLANWRDYIDDKRKFPYRGIRGGFAPASWYKVMNTKCS